MAEPERSPRANLDAARSGGGAPRAARRWALVCGGSDCRGPAQEQLCASLGAAGVDSLFVGCLDVCRGPVAVVPLKGRWEVVSRVRGPKARRRLVRALEAGKRKPIAAYRLRAGRRRKAVERGLRNLARRGIVVRP